LPSCLSVIFLKCLASSAVNSREKPHTSSGSTSVIVRDKKALFQRYFNDGMHHIGQIFKLRSYICSSWRHFQSRLFENEDKKRSSMHSYVKALSRPFVLGYICSSSSPAPLESFVASAFFVFFQALSVFSPSRFLNFNATAFQASPVSSARCNGWYQ
jgi:hypothetical protein